MGPKIEAPKTNFTELTATRGTGIGSAGGVRDYSKDFKEWATPKLSNTSETGRMELTINSSFGDIKAGAGDVYAKLGAAEGRRDAAKVNYEKANGTIQEADTKLGGPSGIYEQLKTAGDAGMKLLGESRRINGELNNAEPDSSEYRQLEGQLKDIERKIKEKQGDIDKLKGEKDRFENAKTQAEGELGNAKTALEAAEQEIKRLNKAIAEEEKEPKDAGKNVGSDKGAAQGTNTQPDKASGAAQGANTQADKASGPAQGTNTQTDKASGPTIFKDPNSPTKAEAKTAWEKREITDFTRKTMEDNVDRQARELKSKFDKKEITQKEYEDGLEKIGEKQAGSTDKTGNTANSGAAQGKDSTTSASQPPKDGNKSSVDKKDRVTLPNGSWAQSTTVNLTQLAKKVESGAKLDPDEKSELKKIYDETKGDTVKIDKSTFKKDVIASKMQ